MRKFLVATALVLGVLAASMPRVDAQATIGRFTRLMLNGACVVRTGSGTPEGAVVGNVCDVYLRTDGSGGTVVYVKSSGAGTNTGWAATPSAATAAPSSATFITQTADGTLTAEQALSSLATALLVNTNGTGVLTAYAGVTCTNQFLRVLSAAGAGTCNSVSLTLDVTGDLPYANLAQGSALSVLGVAGNATADNASIVAANDFEVLRRSGTSIGFGAIALNQSAAVTGILPGANGGTNNGFFQVSGPAASLKTYTFPNTNSTMVAQDSTDTLTNKTLNVESTGNVITTVGKEFVRAARCDNVTASAPEWSFPTSDPAVPACVTGSNTQRGVLDFADGAAVLSAQLQRMLPGDWTGNVDVKIVWHTPAIAGDVVWQVATACVADAETGDPAFNAASTVTDTAKGTTNQFNDASITNLTMTGCAAGESWFVKVLRDPANGADTLADTARLVAVELTTRRAQ